MWDSRLAIAIALAALVPACASDKCLRNTDCPNGETCSSGTCRAPPVDAGIGDAVPDLTNEKGERDATPPKDARPPDARTDRGGPPDAREARAPRDASDAQDAHDSSDAADAHDGADAGDATADAPDSG